MMNRILTFSFFVCFLFVQATIHPYYVSTLNIDYRPNREALQITMRVFTDDWQLMLNTHYDKRKGKDSVHHSLIWVLANFVIPSRTSG